MTKYIQGLISGGIFVFAAIIFIGANSSSSQNGRYQVSTTIGSDVLIYETVIDTKTGEIASRKRVEPSHFAKQKSLKKLKVGRK